MYKKLKFGEFFSGPGGMSLGAKTSNINLGQDYSMESMFAVDYDREACATYHQNIHGDVGEFYVHTEGSENIPGVDIKQKDGVPLVLNIDVRNVNPKNLHNIDAFLFGFPCNDFSNAGERKGLNGDFGMLYKEGLKLLKEKRPIFFVAENVSGLLHANNYGAFLSIMTELQLTELGEEGHNYIITPHMYKFEEYGVPQSRHRIIIVGVRADVARSIGVERFMPPAPTHLNNPMTVGEALSHPYPLDVKNHSFKSNHPIVKERLENTLIGENIWEAMKRPDFPDHLKIKATGACISSIYKILNPDKPAYTIVGSGGGGTHMYHWDRRPTTDRERARIQTFPDDYVFSGGQTSVRKQIGMAVPPRGAQIIIESVLKMLNGIEYEFVAPNLDQEMDSEFVAKKQEKRQKMLDARERKKAFEKSKLPKPELIGDVELMLRIKSEIEALEQQAQNDILAEPPTSEVQEEFNTYVLEAAE